ncbi:F-box domain- Skp2-like protein [Apiospora marii]|uniref:F-box domain- Skp2-like protein n=1 Tax=Apiospora marii TaxID=335849 RepID=UPI003130FE14
MAKLMDLPDELLLDILQGLSIDSFYCLARTCRRFRRLSYDRTLTSFCLRPQKTPYRPLDYSGVPDTRPIAPGLCEVKVNLFSAPREYGPPWNFDPAALSGAPSWMPPHDLRHNIYTPAGDVMFEIAGLLLRDTLCSVCKRLRRIEPFRLQLQRAMRPVHCAGCQKFHARIHFPEMPTRGSLQDEQRLICIGSTARFRVCAHKRFDFDEYTEACFSPGAFACGQCDTAFDPSIGRLRTYFPLAQQRESDPDFGSQEALLSIRRRLEQSGLGQACPHTGTTDPVFMGHLFHTIRRHRLMEVERCQAKSTYKRLLDYGGMPRGCRICKASFYLRYQRSRSDGTEPATDLGLVVSRPVAHIPSPSDSRWLAQRENTGDNRSADAQGLTWCTEPTCGTSKGRRKEALLLRMLEAAVVTPETTDDTYNIIRNAELLKSVFLWVWSIRNRHKARLRYKEGPWRPEGPWTREDRWNHTALWRCAIGHAMVQGEDAMPAHDAEKEKTHERYRAYLMNAHHRISDVPPDAKRQCPFAVYRQSHLAYTVIQERIFSPTSSGS